jgi:uncharacterized protein with GYD domain
LATFRCTTAGRELPLGAVVGRFDFSGIGEEDQESIAGAADLDLQVAGQVTG